MSMTPSATLVISQMARDMRTRGVDVISLSAGEPDFATPPHVNEAAINAINNGQTKYTNVDGIDALKSAVCDKFLRGNKLKFTPDQINVSPGGKAVIFNALAATLNPNDEVIIPAPCWVSYPEMVRLAGGNPIIVSAGPEDSFKLTPDALARAITPKTKWLMINAPSNPDGHIYSATELRALAKVLQGHPNIMVLSDDIYEHLVYDDADFVTMAEAVPEMMPRTLTMNGVSKAYAMTGWRIGYAGGPKWLIKAMAKVMGQTTSNASSISQHAALAALNGPQDFLAERNALFQHRRELVLEAINACRGLACATPGGAFYAFVDCKGLMGKTSKAGAALRSDTDLVTALLEEAHIAVVPGSAFHYPDYFRLSFACDEQTLRRALKRLAAFCNSVD